MKGIILSSTIIIVFVSAIFVDNGGVWAFHIDTVTTPPRRFHTKPVNIHRRRERYQILYPGTLMTRTIGRTNKERVLVLFSNSDSGNPNQTDNNDAQDNDNVDDDMFSLEAFQKAKEKTEDSKQKAAADDEDFDGYKLRDVIYEKWGACYDVDFNRVDSFGFRKLYLNVLPFQLGRRPFRHKTELDYLCHLQAVVEILQKYNQLEYILYQIQETNKKPIPGRSPLIAVPLRLDLTPEQVKQILNY